MNQRNTLLMKMIGELITAESTDRKWIEKLHAMKSAKDHEEKQVGVSDGV